MIGGFAYIYLSTPIYNINLKVTPVENTSSNFNSNQTLPHQFLKH